MGTQQSLWRDALTSDQSKPRMWYSAGVSLLAFFVAALACMLLLGKSPTAMPTAVASGLVAMFAAIGFGLVPAGMTRQVGLPSALAVAAALPLAWAGDGRPVVAFVVTAIVVVVGSLSQADVPVGLIASTMGSTIYMLVFAVNMTHRLPLADVALAAVIAFVSAALCYGLLGLYRKWGWKRGAKNAPMRVPAMPPILLQKYRAEVAAAARDWRHNPYARLALRRVLVIPAVVAAFQYMGSSDPTQPLNSNVAAAGYSILALFTVTQETLRESAKRVVARIIGTLAACALAVGLALVLPPLVVVLLGVLAMAFGLAYMTRNQFYAAAGTTVFALAAGMAAPHASAALLESAAAGRLAATVAGALLGLLVTLLIPPPRQPTAEPHPVVA